MIAIFGHRGFRGGRGTIRENTVEAFAAAREAGADGVELDVRMTADGRLVVHHDARVPGAGPIANIEATALPGWVPELPAALEACAPLAVNVEVKHDPDAGPSRRVAEAAARVLAGRREPGGVLVSSFDTASLEAVRAVAPGLALGLIVDWRTDAEAALRRAGALGCWSLHPFVTQVDAGLVAGSRAPGLRVHVWTVNADADLAAMATLGVDAVITDRVDAAVRVLRGSGWNGGGNTG